MLKKTGLGLSMIFFLVLGVTQLSARNLITFCPQQLCCQDTYNGQSFTFSVVWDPYTVSCYYGTSNITSYDTFCPNNGCQGD